jgi:hypothetical protein
MTLWTCKTLPIQADEVEWKPFVAYARNLQMYLEADFLNDRVLKLWYL